MSPTLGAAHLPQLPHVRQFLVGYSGGLDSHVLLHWLRHQQLPQAVSAIYIDHGLQAAAAAWGEHCATVCQTLQVPLQRVATDARPQTGESPEAAARRVRYAAFAAQVDAHTAILTAHHADDQAETLLLQLLRGSGVHGLAAMPSVARCGAGWLLRPLLGVTRRELRAYAEAHGLHWVEDPSNRELCFDRNYLRHQVLPLLQQRWPAVARTVGRAAGLCAEAATTLDAVAAQDLLAVQGEQPQQLHLAALRNLNAPRQRQVLRYWLRSLQLPVPDASQLQQLLQDMLGAAADRNPCVAWPGVEVRRYQQMLYALPQLPPLAPQTSLLWRMVDGQWPRLALPGSGVLYMQHCMGQGLQAAYVASGALQVRFRQGGERFRPLGRPHSQELKKLLQEAAIPPWERQRLPLLYQVQDGDAEPGIEPRLLAVVGLGIAAECAVPPNVLGWQPMLRRFS